MKMLLSLFFIILIIMPVNAAPPIQSGNNCEQIAVYYQEKYHTDIYVVFVTKQNGAYTNGRYAGHIFNSKVINGHRYFFSFGHEDNNLTYIFSSEQEVIDWNVLQNQIMGNYNVYGGEVYHINKVPFRMARR